MKRYLEESLQKIESETKNKFALLVKTDDLELIMSNEDLKNKVITFSKLVL